MAMKHDYFIVDLGQPRGWFKAHRYRYSCLRCGWAFIVENWSGKVRAVGKGDEALPDTQSIRRVETFVAGPCEPLSAETTPARPNIKLPARKARQTVRRRADGVVQIVAAR
jgi:hypothetical protein